MGKNENEALNEEAIAARWRVGKGRKLGDVVVEMGLATREAVEAALHASAKGGHKNKVGRALVHAGLLDEEGLAKAIAKASGKHAYVAVDSGSAVSPSPLPEDVAKRHSAVCIGQEHDRRWRVAISDPGNFYATSELKALLGDCVFLVGSEPAIASAIDKAYDREGELKGLSEDLRRDMEGIGGDDDSGIGEDNAAARLVATILETAVSKRASDVHIEPQSDCLRIRMRVDGDLRVVLKEGDSKIAQAVAQRLKMIAGLKIEEKRLPQDGRFPIVIRGRSRDARIATAPSAHGEKIVVRLLASQNDLKNLDDLGMHRDDLADLKAALACPNGLLLVTGPTGSGKTTTLYSALNQLNTEDVNIVTVEDPVEIQINGLTQQQANEKLGFTFAKALRGILRQDPDIILIGEMRDEETVCTGLRAALTGHLVLSTLHTNDAKTTPPRLIDMGGDRSQVASTLRLVVAQRLIKRACVMCAAKLEVSASERIWVESIMGAMPDEGYPMVGTGKNQDTGAECEHCEGTGWHGRAAVHECLLMTDDLKDVLAHGTEKEFNKAAAAKLGEGTPAARTLAARAIRMAFLGLTTIGEAQKVAGGV